MKITLEYIERFKKDEYKFGERAYVLLTGVRFFDSMKGISGIWK